MCKKSRAICDHLIGVAARIDQGIRRKRMYFACGTFPMLVRMQFEDQLPPLRQCDRALDESLTILRHEGLAHVGGANEKVIAVRKIILDVPRAIVEIRNASDNQLFGWRSLANKEP